MPTPNPPRSHRRSWAYAVTAIIVLAVQQGWPAEQVTALAVSLLVLIALITSAGRGGE
ncbi:hypothetical protein ACIBO4_39475 [Streptomyces sp. NPDC050149]|uniref:hypothetical protein n=1 Tax=Streptomyces sp. NPDC050149 TaxID=3365603 RepID=UPI003790CBC9